MLIVLILLNKDAGRKLHFPGHEALKKGPDSLTIQTLGLGLCHEGEPENGGLSCILHARRENVRNFVDNACNLLKLLLLVSLYRMS